MLLVFVVILALEQLGIETALLNTAVTAVLAAAALALALAFGIGSRDLARNIMAGFHAKEAFGVGQTLRVGAHTGKLVEIGAVKAVLETESGLVSLPNATLTEEEVLNYCGEIPRYKRPRKVFFGEIPRSPTGKIEKPNLRKKYTGREEAISPDISPVDT